MNPSGGWKPYLSGGNKTVSICRVETPDRTEDGKPYLSGGNTRQENRAETPNKRK
jgi:hypothetical protein